MDDRAYALRKIEDGVIMGIGTGNDTIRDRDYGGLRCGNFNTAEVALKKIAGRGHRDLYLMLSVSLAFIILIFASISPASCQGTPPIPSIPGPVSTPQITPTPAIANQPPVGLTLVEDKKSPQQAGTTITWTAAHALDPEGDKVFYQFWLRGPSTGAAWTAKTGWSESNTFTWHTSSADAGTNRIRAWARDGYHEGPAGFDVAQEKEFTITGAPAPVNQPPVASSLSPNKPSPQQAGSAVTWTAQASDPEGDQIYYQFLLSGPRTGGAWVSQTDWTASNSWTWITASADVGQSQVQVRVRDGRHAGPDGYDSNRVLEFSITRINQPPAIRGFAPDRPSPQLPGTWVKWTASASDPDGDQIYYRFLLRGPSTGGTWADQSGGWTKSNSWIWRTSIQDAGQSQIGVWIRDGKHAPTAGYDDNAVGNFAIVAPSPPPNEPPVITGLGSSLQSPQQSGTLIRWAASASDPDGDVLYYRYYLRGPATGSSWQMVRDWSQDSTWSWATGPSDAGQNQVQVWVRDDLHASLSGWDDQADAYFTVLAANRPPQISSISPSLQSPQPAGSQVVWTAQAFDPDGDVVQYRFLLNGPSTGGAWTIARDWSSSNTWTWNSGTEDAGDYTVTVYVRDGKHAGTEGYDGSKSASYRLAPPAARKITAGMAFKDRPSLAFAVDGYILAYQSWENGQGSLGDIRLQKFGPTWTAVKSVWAVNNNAYQDSPSVLFAGGSYYVAYMSEEKGNRDIFVKKYDASLNLVETHQLTTAQTDQESPSLISAGSGFILAYHSMESGRFGNIYVTQFDQSWTPVKTVQVTDLNSNLERPSIVFARGSFYVAYASDEDGNMDVYIRKLDADLLPGEIKKMTTGSGDHEYPYLTWTNGQFILLYDTLSGQGYDVYMDRFYRDWTPIDSSAVVTDLSDAAFASIMYSPPDRTYWLSYAASDQEGHNIYVKPIQPATSLKDCEIAVTFSATRAGAPYVMTAKFYNNYGELTDPSDIGFSWSPQDAATSAPGSAMRRISRGTYQFSSTFGSAGDKSFRIIASIDGCLAMKTAAIIVT